MIAKLTGGVADLFPQPSSLVMRRYCRKQISLRTCSIFYILTLIFNFFLCSLLFLDIQVSETPRCHCPSTAPLVSTCAPLPTEKQRSKGPNGDPYILVVMVLSSLKGRDRRDTIRQTWAKDHETISPSVLVRFAIGMEGVAAEDAVTIEMEASTYHDLLLLPNLQESYSNLTRKMLVGMTALDALFEFSYLLKCDDDTFIVLETIAKELGQRTDKRSLYWGFFDGRAHVKRAGKWVEKDWFLCDRYLPYALGGGYVVSHDLVRRVITNSDGLTMYNSEDVSMGVWLSAYNAERKHDMRFNTEFVSRGCRNSYIVSHKQSVNDMLSKHHLLQSRGTQCEKEFQTRLSYVYNWSSEPTKCCERKKGVA
jgi:galactosylxylosylprotein 3-beta-galactosyltransferase